MQVSFEGFILTARHIERQGKTYIECWFVTENGVVKATSNVQQGLFFIHHQAVVSSVDYYIRYYNNKRINSAIGNIAPALKRQMLLNAA